MFVRISNEEHLTVQAYEREVQRLLVLQLLGKGQPTRAAQLLAASPAYHLAKIDTLSRGVWEPLPRAARFPRRALPWGVPISLTRESPSPAPRLP